MAGSISFAIVVLAAALASGASVGQGAGPMTAGRIRALTRNAQAKAADPTEIVLALDASVHAEWGDFESFPISIVRREDLAVLLTTPYMAYRRTLANYLRINRPLDEIPWVAAAVVDVEPARIDAPDIIRIVVERGGTSVAPLEDFLKPRTYMNGNGEQAVIHGGEVRFPLSAFAPGSPVTIAAIPQAGAPFVMRLNDEQLRTLK